MPKYVNVTIPYQHPSNENPQAPNGRLRVSKQKKPFIKDKRFIDDLVNGAARVAAFSRARVAAFSRARIAVFCSARIAAFSRTRVAVFSRTRVAAFAAGTSHRILGRAGIPGLRFGKGGDRSGAG